jgi:hypothetical protein
MEIEREKGKRLGKREEERKRKKEVEQKKKGKYEIDYLF